MALLSSYNDLPYACRPVPYTHPDNLACKAMLYGLTPAAIATCRVLEIGCGNGTNLLSLSQILPGAQFVGIDNAQNQIEQGKSIAAAIACTNVQLHTLSVADLCGQFGKFDYVICHGVYSWVSSSIAQHILRAIQSSLATAGVAYVSYNVFPGWHLRGLVRDILCRQTDATASATVRVLQARQVLNFLVANAPTSDNAYAQILRREKEIADKSPDSYLFHEHLEEQNEPIYFQQFAERAANNGLQYLGEATFNAQEAMFNSGLLERLNRVGRIEYEQQVDLLCNATFRKSLLCHANLSIARKPSSHAVQHMHIRSAIRLNSAIEDYSGPTPAAFTGVNQESITTPQPILKASFTALAEAWPQTLTLIEIQRRCAQLLSKDDELARHALETDLVATALLRCHRTGLVEFNMLKPSVVTTIDRYPRASALARWQAAQGQPVCNLRNEVIEVENFDRVVISLLDGETEFSELESRLVGLVVRGEIALEQQGQLVKDRNVAETVVQHALALSLKRLAQLNCLR